MLFANKVAIISEKKKIEYPKTPPFLPHSIYPELKGNVPTSQEPNIVYPLVRQLLYQLGMDNHNYSSAKWNPMGSIVKPGMEVLVKPNLVRHVHIGGGDYETVVTHGSIIRGVLDYVALALNGQGCITVGDAPIQGADFNRMLELTCLEDICKNIEKLWGINVRLVDFRLVSVNIGAKHMITNRKVLSGDDRGYISVDLGTKSFLKDISDNADKYRVTCYSCEEMTKHHSTIVNEYLIPKTVLDADVVINLPKLKTHRKVGMTAALKNLVGINGHKDWLPHHRIGSKNEGGDEYLDPSLLKRFRNSIEEKFRVKKQPFQTIYSGMQRILDRVINQFVPDKYEEGSWFGNDTIWRTVLDLNRLLLYADKIGQMKDHNHQRQVLTIVDAIIAGEGEGPMKPDPRRCGLLVGGTSAVAVDAVLATVIGFNFKKMPLCTNGFQKTDWPLVNFDPREIEIVSKDRKYAQIKVGDQYDEFNFRPPSGWNNYVEFVSIKK